MSKVSKKITNWLYSVLQPQYTHPESAYRDIYQFLLVYIEQGFKVRTAVYTSVHGGSDLLVNLYGPLTCGNNVFQVSIWIPSNYPLAEVSGKATRSDANGVPVIFAVPSKGQSIRPGNNVDSQGKVYHPFLVQWYTTTSSGNLELADKFNLILLMKCLTLTFERCSPVGLAPQTTGPALPPKPISAVDSRNQAGPSTLNNGPPLPKKLLYPDQAQELMLQKYRVPPPLPTHPTSSSHWSSFDSALYQPAQAFSPGLSVIPAQINGLDHDWPKEETRPVVQPVAHQDRERSQDSFEKESRQKALSCSRESPSEIEVGETTAIEDLMDQVTLESEKDNSDPRVLQRIAQHINRHLDIGNPESVNNKVPRVRKTRHIARALYSQLVHHNSQARANVKNLEKHTRYLDEQVESVSKSNEKLHELAEINKNSPTDICLGTSGDRKISIDDLVLPDLMLVRQLYDSVAEIKGYKDAIKLVGGTYRSEPELINNLTLESCIKSVRALSRELFWLEVTKDEIGRVMGLQR